VYVALHGEQDSRVREWHARGHRLLQLMNTLEEQKRASVSAGLARYLPCCVLLG
jgi:hypothetical protein